MIALVAVFALLVQALIPAIASAAPASSGDQVICTSHGLMSVTLDDTAPAGGADSAPCDHCVCPPVAAAPPVSLAPAVAIAYARAAEPGVDDRDLPPPARAPPRPPGQGPPTSNA